MQPSSALGRRFDQGGYVILRASYGTTARSIDVTDQLKALARRDRRIRVSNELFGHDPARGQVKVLRIYAEAERGVTRVFEYREKDFVDGAQFLGWSEGEWGRNARGPEGWDRNERGFAVLSARYGQGDRARDVTRQLRQLVHRGRLDVVVENGAFNLDPAPGRRKYLTVVYSVDGMRRHARAQEHDRLSLP